MEMIPAPTRTLKTWSMRLLFVAGLFDSGVALVHLLSDAHIMDAGTLALVNAALVVASGGARFVAQQIPISTEDKIAMIESVAKAPVHPGEFNVDAQIIPAAVPTKDDYRPP